MQPLQATLLALSALALMYAPAAGHAQSGSWSYFGADRAFARYAFAESLPEELRIHLVQTGEGTFWTDLQGTGGANT